MFKRKDKKFFSFKYIKNEINKLAKIELKKDFFSVISEVKNFEKSFDILNSLDGQCINAQFETEGFEDLGSN